MNRRPDISMEKRSFQTSCERCRKRKIKCDLSQPCSRCSKANVDCVYIGSGEKRRPVPRGYVAALEAQIASLEKFIAKLIAVDAPTRDELLSNFSKTSNHFPKETTALGTDVPLSHPNSSGNDSLTTLPIRSRTGHLKKLKDGQSSEFYGATSFFQMHPSDNNVQTFAPSDEPRVDGDNVILHGQGTIRPVSNRLSPERDDSEDGSTFSPKSEICKYLMGEFFRKQYHYFMYLYREGFILHYDAGSGPYYSEVLLYAICALGAMVSDDLRELSDIFFGRAQELLYGFALESPNLTTLQALLLMGHREIGQGRTSKGWLMSGMAFRLAHEMGLHLDPNNWNESEDSRVEREILRRTYWAAFVADKQLSLYFGRPPALHPNESDVITTVRIPYPPEWQSLLNKYVVRDALATEFEDGDGLVAFFVQQAELSKILYRIITEVFENRGVKAVEDVLAASVRDITVSLRKWASDLPAKLHWNEWSVGKIPYLVLYLHMQFHTAQIILHRPPRLLFKDPKISTSEDLATCYESLDNIVKLLKSFSRTYNYNYLPVTFVHILASASSVVLMRQHIGDLDWNDSLVSVPLDFILEAVDGISQTWSWWVVVPFCNIALQVKSVIMAARISHPPIQAESPDSFDLMTFAEGDIYDTNHLNNGLAFDEYPSGFFDDILDWNNASFP